jgi:hypothetical protein
MFAYKLLDIFFFVFHLALILFNIFGWIPRRWRKLNLITLSLTAFSWFGLGLFYGFGYCPFTDWHWEVREILGYTIESNSYIHFLVTQFTGIEIEERTVDVFTVVFFFAAFFMSVFLNLRDKLRTSCREERV